MKLSEIKFLIRRVIYVSLYWINGIFRVNSANQVVILCYHAVGRDNWRFSIDFEILKKQVTYLMAHYNPITLADLELNLARRKKISEPSFILTFDDGYRDVLLTKDYFAKLGIKPTLFVLSDRKNANRNELETPRPFLSKAEILELVRAGWSIGCHSASHSNLTMFEAGELSKEVLGAKRSLENELGVKISYFSYPKGNYSKKVLDVTKKAGYKLGLTMDDGFIKKDMDPLLIPRVGVDRTHSFSEFKSLFLPLSIVFRRLAKDVIS